jgi:hypothetical protein
MPQPAATNERRLHRQEPNGTRERLGAVRRVRIGIGDGETTDVDLSTHFQRIPSTKSIVLNAVVSPAVDHSERREIAFRQHGEARPADRDGMNFPMPWMNH